MAMRSVLIGTIAAAALVATQAAAQGTAPGATLTPIRVPVSVTRSEVPPPDLALGEDVAIACDAIERVADPSDVRVVLTIAAVPGDSSPGYKKILAVNEKVMGSAVHLKVPSAPDLENHTVNLSVYVVDGAHRNDCDGGQYRIVQTPPKPTHG
jgi:hypothetical protein